MCITNRRFLALLSPGVVTVEYSSETRLIFKHRETLHVYNIHFSCSIILKLCSEHDSVSAMLCAKKIAKWSGNWEIIHGKKTKYCKIQAQTPRKLFMLYWAKNQFFTTFSNFKHGYIKKFYWSSHIFHWSSHFFISRGPRTDKFRRVCELNSLWPSDTIWWHRSGLALAQVMACCLIAPSHYLNQCWLTWLIIKSVLTGIHRGILSQ